jgi:hypothetical protein
LLDLAGRCTLVLVLGNHEEMLLASLQGKEDARYWLRFGSAELEDTDLQGGTL